MSLNPPITISRVRDGSGIHLHMRGATQFFTNDMWTEFSHMIMDFNTTGVREMRNFVPLPTKTPIHDNIPRPLRGSTLEDLA